MLTESLLIDLNQPYLFWKKAKTLSTGELRLISKSEIRNNIECPEYEFSKQDRPANNRRLVIWQFEFWICFGFRD